MGGSLQLIERRLLLEIGWLLGGVVIGDCVSLE